MSEQDSISPPLQFAVAIVHNGVVTEHIVTAAVGHQVHIIDKELFDISKDYSSFCLAYRALIQQSNFVLLFILPGGSSVIAEDTEAINQAVEAMQREYLPEQ